MKRTFVIFILVLCCLLTGCGKSNLATVKVLETCKVIGSPITETSISSNEEYFMITFENDIFYCEDKTARTPVWTIKIPNDKDIDAFPILASVVPQLLTENFEELETNGHTRFFKTYHTYWFLEKTQEGRITKYTIEHN